MLYFIKKCDWSNAIKSCKGTDTPRNVCWRVRVCVVARVIIIISNNVLYLYRCMLHVTMDSYKTAQTDSENNLYGNLDFITVQLVEDCEFAVEAFPS